MALKPPSSLAPLRGALWRWRHVFGVLALVAAALAFFEASRPEEEGSPILVAARAVPAGEALSPGDLRTVVTDLPVDGGFSDPNEVDGRTLAVGVRAGDPILPGMVVGPGLAEGAPPEHTVLSVAVADPGSQTLAEPGRRVNLIGAIEWSEGEVLATNVRVLAQLPATESANLLQSVQHATVLVVAVPDGATSVVTESSAVAPLRVAVPSTS